jgi:FkbM family methyltransferase
MEIQCDGARSTLRNDWYMSKTLDREIIQVRRLEDVLSNAEINEVQLWKLDVEGAEYDALVGAGDDLASQRIKHIFLTAITRIILAINHTWRHADINFTM